MFNRISILIMLIGTLPLCAIAGTIQLPKTGQTTSYAAGDDGDLERGVAWPGLRFTDNGNGTITDNLTGLIWLKNANCFGTQTWANAISSSNSLASGACDLTDGSHAGDWRLPNRKELRSLVDYSRYNPALPGGHPFTNVQFGRYWLYWSSSTSATGGSYAWLVNMGHGEVTGSNKSNYYYFWPVRAGQPVPLGDLIVNFSDTGDGTVTGNGVRNGNAVSFSTNTGSTEQFDIGTTVNLHGEPSGFSHFTGWTGYDTVNGSDCILTMTAGRDVTAFFDIYNAHKARIGDTENYFTTLQAAYNNAPDPPGVIKAWATDYSENLTCAQTKNATLEGGYNEGYTSNNGFTTLKGNLSVEKGAVTVENIIITASDTVTHTYTIFGRIDYNGTGLSGVTVALSGTSSATATTDAGGDYKFPGLSNGPYTVTPTLTGYTVTPTQVTINNANALLDFTAVKDGYTISGRITYNGKGLNGVAVALTGAGTGNTITDASGNYSFTGLSNGSYTLTPSLTGYLFTPANLPATVSSANVSGKNFTATLNSITHPSSLVGTWSSETTYTEDSDGDLPYTETGSGTFNADGTLNNGSGAWASYKNMLVVGDLWDDDGKGVECAYFPSVNSPITGFLEDIELDDYYWWERGSVTVTKVNNTDGSDQLHRHPANLVGTWSVAATYTSSSDGNLGSHNSTETVTLNADGTVSARGATIGFWFSDDDSVGDVFGVGYFWDKAAESGFKCHFMNLSGPTSASGYIEDKKLTGSLWWGRGNVSMTKQ